MSYNIKAIINEFRKAISSIDEVDELIQVIDGESKTAYKTIFKKVTKFLKDNEDEYSEILELWNELLEKHVKTENETPKKTETKKSNKKAESEKAESEKAESEKAESEKAESDCEDSDLVIVVKKNLDTSEYEDLEYIKNFDKEQLCKIFDEDQLQEYEHEDHIYYEWKIMFGEFYYSIYTSDLGEDIMWIIAGNEKKNKKNLELLYKAMNEKLQD